MRNSRKRFNTFGVRKSGGQAIVEGLSILVVISLLGVGLLLLLLNASKVSSYNYQLQSVALHAARQINANKWWIAMQYHNYQDGRDDDKDGPVEGQVRENALKLVNAELKQLNLPECTNFEVTRKNKLVGDSDRDRFKQVSFVTVKFDVAGVPVVSGGIFPNTITLHAQGLSSDAEYSVRKHGLALILAVDPKTNEQRAIRVPVYNATIGHDEPANLQYLRMGDSIGPAPQVNVTIRCKNKGIIRTQNGDYTWDSNDRYRKLTPAEVEKIFSST